jgi:hypothetical protein
MLRRAVKVAAEVSDRVRPPASDGVVVLIYHRVGGQAPSEIDLPLDLFRAQMEELAASGGAGTLDDALTVLAGVRAEGPKVVVTFDDGTADIVDHALPVLVETGVPALLYAATAFIDDGISFPGDGRPVSWSALADAHATGLLTVGSHTHTHALLDRLDSGAVDGELDRSIELIGEHIGEAPRHFAYPKALMGSAYADAAIRQRFVSAALSGSRPNRVGHTDPFRLARSPIQVSDGLRWFRRKVDGGMALEEAARNLRNRRAYKHLTT